MTTSGKRWILRRTAHWATVLAVVALGLVALGARRPDHGGQIRLPTASPIHSLDPVSIRWPAEATIGSILYDSPYQLTLSGLPRPHLLHPITSLGGGRTLRLKVRPHAVFHDGSPIRADHVVASLRRLAKSREHGWLLAMVEGSAKSGPSGLQVTGTGTLGVQVTPTLVITTGLQGTPLTVTMDSTGYTTGTFIGHITVTATTTDVLDTPQAVPVTLLVVPEVYRAYLPVTLRSAS